MAVTCTLSEAAGRNIVDGRSYELKATSSSAVETDPTVEIMRDAVASDAGDGGYSVGRRHAGRSGC